MNPRPALPPGEPLRREALRAGARTLTGSTVLALGLSAGTPPAAASTAPPAARGSVRVSNPATMITRRPIVTSDGISLSLIGAGKPSALPPLLFLPGWCMPAELFRPQIDFFAASRQVWALDPRGQGESQIAESGYDANRRAKDLFECLGRLKRAPIVVAWSLAGIEMLHGLSRWGDSRLAALVLVDSSLGEGPAGSNEGIKAFREQLETARETTLRDFARAIFRHPQSEARLDQLQAAMSRVPLAASQAMLDYQLPRETLRDTARGFRKPLLVTCIPQYRQQAALHKAARPATQVELFEEAGHALFADEPDRFNRVLDTFSRERVAAAAAPRRKR